jgi:hypothetical protein
MDALARLVAIEEIKQLKARYFRCMDTRDWDGMSQVFCKDARFDCSEGYLYTPLGGKPVGAVGPITTGRDTIMDWISSSFVNATSVHHGHCHEITIDDDTHAHGVIAMADFLRLGDRKTVLVEAAGHYWEKYRFEDGAWRIAESKLTRLFSDTRDDEVHSLLDKRAEAVAE